MILTSVPNENTAHQIESALLDSRLAACIQRSAPIKSTYRWKGQRETQTEIQLWIKTSLACQEAAFKLILELHPYDVPELLSIPVQVAHEPYLEWINGETRSS